MWQNRLEVKRAEAGIYISLQFLIPARRTLGGIGLQARSTPVRKALYASSKVLKPFFGDSANARAAIAGGGVTGCTITFSGFGPIGESRYGLGHVSVSPGVVEQG